jgi:hypothetical protein
LKFSGRQIYPSWTADVRRCCCQRCRQRVLIRGAERPSQCTKTATDQCAATPAPGSSTTVGGTLAPFWQSWTYDAAGNRLTQTDHDTTGNTGNDTKTTYTYPPAGSATDQPHTLTSTSATGPNAGANTASYGYDTTGNTTGITGGALGNLGRLTFSGQSITS